MNRKRVLPSFLALTIITLIAGAALGATYSLTKDTIDEQVRLDGERARASVIAGDVFTQMDIAEDSGINECHIVERDGVCVGYVVQITEKGFAGGDIDIIAGVDTEGRLTGVSVGGSNFSETPGLGAKAKDADFLNKFIDKKAPLSVKKANDPAVEGSIDAITCATITSNSVVNGVNKILDFVSTLQENGGDAQ